MKKLILSISFGISFLLFFCCGLIPKNNFCKVAQLAKNLAKNYNLTAFSYSSKGVVYAKASGNCALYAAGSNMLSNMDILFYVPESYFVSVISSDKGVCQVQYKSFVGKCYEKELTVVNFVPVNPVLSGITFDIGANSTQIWTKPSDEQGTSGEIIPADTRGLEYIAQTIGDIPFGGKSNVWYYARYTPASNTTIVHEGYVYSERTTNLTHIPTNLEGNDSEIGAGDIAFDTAIDLSVALKVILIILISSPFVVLIIISIIKAKNEFAKNKHTTAEPSAPTEKEKPKLSYVKKTRKPAKPNDEDTIEVVFPEYNYIDDDDLL